MTNNAADIFSKTIFNSDKYSSLDNVYDELTNLFNNRHMTLSSFIKPALITAPLFVEEIIANDEVYQGISKNLLNLYASFIMVAMELDQVIDGSSTIRDNVHRVSTENFMKYINTDEVKSYFLNKKISLESNDSGITKPVGIKSMFATGRLLEINTNIKSDNRKSITFKLYTQFINRILTRKFMINFIDVMYKDKKYRFTKYLAGEISFWKDLVFGIDKIKKMKKTLKDIPPDDINMINTLVKKSHINFVKKLVLIIFEQNASVNIHNNIYVISNTLFKECCTKNGINYKRKKDIDKLMFNLKAIFLVIVDQMNHVVDIKIAGLNFPSTYTYKEMIQASNEKSDMFEMMNIFDMLKHGSNNSL